MQTVFETAVIFLVADGWPVVRVDESTTLRMDYQGENAQWTCIAQTLEDRRTLIFHSVYPEAITPDKYDVLLEYIARANYGMLGGNFEIDLSDGDLRYRTSVTVPDVELSLLTIKQVVYDNVTAMDLYLPGIQAVLSGEFSPADAIERVEENINRVDE